jgi:transposase
MALQVPRHPAGADLAPGNYESAGKRLSGQTRQGSVWLRTALVAVAHTILTIIYHLLRYRTTYCELGSQYFDERDRQATERRLVRRLEALGNRVTAEPVNPAT